MYMEKENWIESIFNSTNGITAVNPNADLFAKIQQRIQKEARVSPKTLWLVAASVAVLIILNIKIISAKSDFKHNSTAAYLEMTVNKSNQLY